MLYSERDWAREVEITKGSDAEPYRQPWRRDFARLIHSPIFRRLQGKTQVFPGRESDFFRNRLTHSLEVAQIAKSIALRLNHVSGYFSSPSDNINADLVELAGLAHDLGHPPFGHNGEEALDECMNDFGGFEGNAQTLRIVSRLEKKELRDKEAGAYQPISEQGEDRRIGLNFTYRNLASILKYDRAIPVVASDRSKPGVVKGYYQDDEQLVRRIKLHVVGTETVEDFKTIECSIMDVADDIAYSTYDLEDNFKGEFLSPMKLFALPTSVLEAVGDDITRRARRSHRDVVGENYVFDVYDIYPVLAEIFQTLFQVDSGEEEIFTNESLSNVEKKMLITYSLQDFSEKMAQNGYYRTSFTSALVERFIQGIEVIPHQEYPQLHQARLEFTKFIEVEVLKNITYHAVIRSPRVQVVEYRGKDIVRKIFEALRLPGGIRLLPADFQVLCGKGPEALQMRTIADFVAGMTDRYAIEFYTRLFGAEGLTIHKPL